MKRSLSILVALAMLTGVAAADTSPMRVITVAGEGQISAEPDMATITLGVTYDNTEAKAAMDAVSEAVRKMLSGLEAQGIATKDLQTRQLSINPVWSN